MAHFGTSDVRQVANMAADGDERAKLVLEAMAHNVAKHWKAGSGGMRQGGQNSSHRRHCILGNDNRMDQGAC